MIINRIDKLIIDNKIERKNFVSIIMPEYLKQSNKKLREINILKIIEESLKI